MCVLVVSDKRRPTEDECEKMNAANQDGVGLAWREKVKVNGKEEVVIKWEKGLDLSEAKALIEQVPLPFVLHFRIASCGGKAKELTHPFPVEREMRKDLSGTIKGQVLFHNGHWVRYQDCGIDGAIKNRIKVPEGKWSDTRVMAWLTHLHGPGILELINEKVILFGPEKIEIFHPDGWARVNDLLVSNRGWENQYVSRGNWTRVGKAEDEEDWSYMHQPTGNIRRVCRLGNCNNNAVGDTFYCADHQPPCRWANCNKPRVIGSEHCIEHQSPCIASLCASPRVTGEKYCEKHLKLEAARAIADAEKAGGTSTPVPFRSGTEVVPAGDDNGEGSEGVREEVDGVGEGLPHGSTDVERRPAILNDPIAQAQSKWARSLNPKTVSTPHVRPNMELLRVIDGQPLTNVM